MKIIKSPNSASNTSTNCQSQFSNSTRQFLHCLRLPQFMTNTRERRKHMTTRSWADLPKDLLETIGRSLDSQLDLLRFRSVCTSWRSSVPPPSFDTPIPPLIIKLPRPFPVDAVPLQSTICHMRLCASPSSSFLQKGWLVKVQESTNGKLQLLNPLTNSPVVNYCCSISLSLMNVRFVELAKAYKLRRQDGFPLYGLNKVVFFPVSTTACKDNGFGFLGIYHEGKLGYWRYGDESWTLLDDRNLEYDDIILHKGQYYVVDRWGKVYWIDSSMRVIEYSPPMFGCGGQKNLVESCGDLYVVDRYLDGERRTWTDDDTARFYGRGGVNGPGRWRKATPMTVDFRVFKLDEEWGKWVDVRSLGDQVFVLATDSCFSFSSREYFGGKGDSIIFTDNDSYAGRGLSFDCIRVFQLEDHTIEKLSLLPHHSAMFWPPVIAAS